MPRIYVNQPLVAGSSCELPEAAARHVQVLRLQPGDSLRLFDGSGGEFAAQVLEMGKRLVRVAVGEHLAVSCESPLALTLVQALSAAERMDYTVQKACELGVARLVIVHSAHCAYRLAADRVAKRMEHWRGVAVAAAEQCGRTHLMQIDAPLPLERWLAAAEPADLKLLLAPGGGRRWQDLPNGVASAHVLIGPEGGFSLAEEAAAQAAGYAPLLLGPRLLRTETVAPVIAALLQARYGDL